MSVRARPSALYEMPSCVVVARGTLDPLALVRIQARQPVWKHSELCFEKKQLIPALQQLLISKP